MGNRPYILTVAGFDPSGGAGLLADIKVFESLKCCGLAVCTSLTEQTHDVFVSNEWVPEKKVLSQLKLILSSYSIRVVKIGLIENWEVLHKVLELIHSISNDVKVILDPVLGSSTKFEFHSGAGIDGVLDKVYLLTPNLKEINELYDDLSLDETIARITSKTNLLVKGGHNDKQLGLDMLYTRTGECIEFPALPGNYTAKHGSGCILSSAIAANIELHEDLRLACEKGKRYIEKILASNNSLIAYHQL